MSERAARALAKKEQAERELKAEEEARIERAVGHFVFIFDIWSCEHGISVSMVNELHLH